MSRDEVEYGSKTIGYILDYRNRKSLGIKVTPTQEVLVLAPVGTPVSKVREKVVRRAAWILKQQRFFQSFEPKTPARRYLSGETHLYLGRQYLLKVETGCDAEEVKLKGRYLIVNARDKAHTEELVKGWYRDRARVRFEAIAEPLIRRFRKYGVAPSAFVLREMPTRWGSCSSKGKIILNPELVKAPRGCIEYVIMHELCHLIHHDHTRRFLELQAKEMPDWQIWKERLERVMA